MNVIKVNVMPDGRISRKEAAKYIGVSCATMRTWDCIGRHPEYLKKITVSGRVYYMFDDIKLFVEDQINGIAA